jgi:hypothetical protein
MKNKIFQMYKNISIGKNDICTECNAIGEKEKPLSFYFVGDKFEKGEDTVLFVGKTAVGGADFEEEYKGDFKNELFTDATKFGEASLDLNEPYATGRPFYNYTHCIIEKYYGSYEKGKSFVALTNIVKCNNTSTNDATSKKVKELCINKLGVIWKEIELISPKRVVFFTHDKYDDYIDAFISKNSNKYEELADKNIKIGNKNTPWWHRRYYDKENERIYDFLRLGHPQMMDKSDYVNAVVGWLNETK